MPSLITQELLQFLRGHYQLDWYGIHGVRHWARVRANGLLLSRETGANRAVVELFGFLHDCCRWDDGEDPEHGERAAALVPQLNGRYFDLADQEVALLMEAIQGHDIWPWHKDPTIATCWDADRLHLYRVGVRPDPRYLCTAPGKALAGQYRPRKAQRAKVGC